MITGYERDRWRTAGQVRRNLVYALLAVALLAGYSSCAQVKALPLGGALPGGTLKDQDGHECSLTSYKGKIVVLDFCSIECPYSRGVDPDFQALVAAYASKDVVFLGIDSNKNTTPEQIRQYATDKKLAHPILKDLGNAYADVAGAARTPELFVFDKSQKLAYRGAFDDRKVPDKKGNTCYVKNALEDLLAGQPVKTTQVDAWGCSIKRVK
jgi:thiol-disulfide isomerase/thioredoxin